MSWSLITNAWRLKLLAVGLAILMLGAVAFSQNPPTTKTLHNVPLNYSVGDGIVLINPVTKINVTVSGLADALETMSDDNPRLSAIGDAHGAKPGPAVKVNVKVTPTINNVTVQDPPPVVVNIDTLATKEVPVQVVVRAAPGWSVTKALATCPSSPTPSPCAVHFTGPLAWETNLTASAVVTSTISVGKLDSPNQPIQLANSNGALNLSSVNTLPSASLDANSVNIHVDAQAGFTSSTVPLVDSAPSHGPPTGYRITAVTITPATVVISGDVAVLSRIQSIVLPAMDLSSSTSDATFQVNIPYRTGVTGSPATATIKYAISRNPNVPPTP